MSDARLRELEKAAKAAGTDPTAWLDLAVAALRIGAVPLAWTALDRGARLPPSELRELLVAARAGAASEWGLPFELDAVERTRASQPRRLRFWKPRVTVGRRLGNDIVIDDERVEAHHAFFSCSLGTLAVENRFNHPPPATLVNSAPVISRVRLLEGDTVSFGRTRYVVRRWSDPERPDVSARALARGVERALVALNASR